MVQAVKGAPDISISKAQLQQSPYASIYAKKAKGSRALLILANASPVRIDANQQDWQLKWLSASREMIETQQGRIMKTTNFIDGNLVHSYSRAVDPLQLGLLNPTTPKTWQRFVDWQPGNYSHIQLNSTFSPAKLEQVEINDEPVTAWHVTEQVEVPQLNISYQNQFWLDPTSQAVIASIQRPAPLISEIEIQLLKPYSGI